jgi:hypothetical protein
VVNDEDTESEEDTEMEEEEEKVDQGRADGDEGDNLWDEEEDRKYIDESLSKQKRKRGYRVLSNGTKAKLSE